MFFKPGKKFVVALIYVVLSLLFAQIPATPTYAAVVCQGEAAYPPDLPDCLDPVVAAEQAAATKAAEDARLAKIAADEAAAAAAARAAQIAAAERAAAEQAAAKAAADKAAADALAEQIRQGNLAAAARAAKEAADKAIADAETARLAKVAAEAAVTARIQAEAAARAEFLAAQQALADAQARIAQEIADAKAESDKQKALALEKKRLADAAAARFAEERIALDRQIAEAEAARIAKENAARASENATTNALEAYLAAGGSLSLREQNLQVTPSNVSIKKQSLLTEPKIQSYLKIKIQESTIFVTAEELSRLRQAYLSAKAKSDADREEANRAIAAKAAADAALAEKKAIADAAAAAFRAAALAKKAADDAAAAAAAEKVRLENEIKVKEAEVLSKQAEIAAAQAEATKKAALLTAANSAATSLASASQTLQSITSDSGNSSSLAAQALAAFQNVAAASNDAADAAVAAAAAAARESAAQAAAIRAREEAQAAAERAARNPSYSGPSVRSLELEAIAAEKAAKEAEQKAKEAKEAEEKALAEKEAAEKAAAQAKAAADKAAAEALAQEKAKRNAARKKIQTEQAKAIEAISKVQEGSKQDAGNVDKSDSDINTAYKKAVADLAKVDKKLALLRDKEEQALAILNKTKQELISVTSNVKAAAKEKDLAIAKVAEANFALEKIENEIKSNKAGQIETDKRIAQAEKLVTESTAKYEKFLAVAKTAIAKAAESKRAAESAYTLWQNSINAPRILSSNLTSGKPTSDDAQTANAQSALSKFKEQYDLAQKQYEENQALADKASADLRLARKAVETAKQNLASRKAFKKSLASAIIKLENDLVSAKKVAKSANEAKAKAVAKYTESENEFALVKSKMNQYELDYQSAQAETKYAYENFSSQTNQVTTLRKLSEFSKSSVENVKDVFNSIQDEANSLRDLKIVDFLNDKSNLSKVALPVLIIGTSLAAVTSVYAVLKRRRKSLKVYEVDPEIENFLENYRKKQERAEKRAAAKKSPAKKSPAKRTVVKKAKVKRR